MIGQQNTDRLLFFNTFKNILFPNLIQEPNISSTFSDTRNTESVFDVLPEYE